jgi:signal transduction histidine kinase/transcriptional regulator with GAF, ATPase, and Fis domain
MEARTQTSTLEESAIIERVARIVFSVRGTKPDYTRLAGELEQAVPFDIFGVVLLRHDRQSIRAIVCERERDNWVANLHLHPLADSMLERMLQKPELYVQDYPDGLDGSPAHSGDALSSYHQLHSTLIVPLMVEDRVLGTLELGSTATHTYADETLQRLMSAVVRVLATAIESVQLGGNAAIQDRQRQALKDVTSALTSKKDLSTVLEHIVSGVSNALGVSAFIFTLDPRKNALHLEVQFGLDYALLEHVLQQPVSVEDECILWQVLKRRQPLGSPDIATDEHYKNDHMLATVLGLHSIYCYPLAIGPTVYGALVVGSMESGGFTPLKTDILALFANQATVAIHNNMLLASVHQRSRFQETLEKLEQEQMHEEFHSSADLERYELQLLRKVREETQATFGVSFSTLMNWIGKHFLTLHEQDLQTVLDTIHWDQMLDDEKNSDTGETITRSVHPLSATSVSIGTTNPSPQSPFAETLALLEQTAQSALTRGAMLGELSRLIMQLKQSTNWVKDAWFVVDLHGVCMYMNPAAQLLFDIRLEVLSTGYSSSLLGPAAAQVQSPAWTIEDIFAKRLPCFRNMEEVSSYLSEFTQGNVYRRELRCVLADEPLDPRQSEQERASDHYYQFTRYPLYTQEGGQLEAYALQVQDVTEQVRDERNRSALLSSVSHDLRTPLTTIKAAVTGLLETNMPWSEQDRRDMLEEIDSETDHLTFQVSSLVELSRIEMGALTLKKEWCDVAEIFFGVLPKLKRVLANRQVKTDIPPRLPLIYADHAQLGQVFLNLVENAARHSPDHTEIAVEMEHIIEEDGEKLCVRVIDHGVGVPESERERIFVSFNSQPSYGNSLALAICKGLIEAHQGEIRAEPATGGGSCFVFTLPLHPYNTNNLEEKPLACSAEQDSRSE